MEQVSSTDDQNFISLIYPGEKSELSESHALLSRYLSVIPPHRLEDIELEPEEVIKHIILFYRHYHEDFPILPGIHYLLQNVQTSNGLVWVIVAITSTRLPLEQYLRVKLIEPMKRLAGASIMGSEPLGSRIITAL